jgi:hypothetical protein
VSEDGNLEALTNASELAPLESHGETDTGSGQSERPAVP